MTEPWEYVKYRYYRYYRYQHQIHAQNEPKTGNDITNNTVTIVTKYRYQIEKYPLVWFYLVL